MNKHELFELLTRESSIFVTGTDTEVGKTYSTSLIIKFLRSQNYSVNPLKIISAGVDPATGINEDAQVLREACQNVYSIDQINPLVLQEPIAPHIAAARENKVLDFSLLTDLYNRANMLAPLTIVEGAGGWYLPVNETELLSDWVAEHKMPVILVVGIRLGCLNHSLLTAAAIKATGCRMIGWVANYLDSEPNEVSEQNVAYLQQTFAKRFDIPLLATINKNQTEL